MVSAADLLSKGGVLGRYHMYLKVPHHNGAFLKTQRHKNINYDMLKYIFCVLS